MTHTLIRPLGSGGSLDHWRLGRLHEDPFDVPFERMAGDMDARFFLSQHKNFIPHEYPCRRIFAERFRDRRPEPVVAFEPAAWWFPFGADRVDLSGFWFRATRVEARARTGLRTKGGPVRLALATCGAAILSVGGQERLWMAPYRRNLPSASEVTIDVPAGDHEVEVWLGDLCERDTRFWFRLTAEGAEACVLPVPVAPERVTAIEALLDGMHMTRPAFPDGMVTVRFAEPAPFALRAAIGVEGHFMSADAAGFARTVEAGARELPLADVAELPADFRYFDIALTDGALEAASMTLARRLGVEVVDAAAQGTAPASLAARVDEALAHVASGSEADPMGALARLATGLAGPATDRMLASSVAPIGRCDDCADFILVPLLWARIRYGDAIGPEVRAEIDRVILSFRYWLDEPGDDVMWFYSENHALLFHTACYLAGGLFPDAVFTRTGRTGREQRAAGRERLLRWLDHFEACEMAEWNSAPYFPIDLKGLCALHALAGEPEIAGRAEAAIHRLLQILAHACHQGLLAASQGRSYEHTLRAARTLELAGITRMLWGRGWYGRQVQALPLLALDIRDHGLVPPDGLAELALWTRPTHLEWSYAQGEGGFAPLYHYKGRHFAIGSLSAYRPGLWGYQETVLHARIGDHPDAQIWINHPGERLISGFARPSFWGGCGTLPRLHQYRALAIVAFDTDPETPDFTHAHLPLAIVDEVIAEERRVLVRSGEGLALLQANGPLEAVTRGPTAGLEQRLAGRRARWIVRLSDLGREGSLRAFADRMAGLELEEGDGTLAVTDPDYGVVIGHASGSVEAEGRILDPKAWTHRGEVRELPNGPLG